LSFLQLEYFILRLQTKKQRNREKQKLENKTEKLK